MPLARFLFTPLFLARCIFLCVIGFMALQAVAVDLNKATLNELQQIKGIGPKTAERIIEERERSGPYDSLKDLSERVKGIGPKRLVTLQALGLHTGDALPLIPSDKNTKNSPK